MLPYSQFLDNYNRVLESVEKACNQANRPTNSVTVLPITKHLDPYTLEYVHMCGLKAVGESFIQEALKKKENLSFPMTWEYIGHLQTNKASLAVKHFERIQTIDTSHLAQKINIKASSLHKIQRILLQINAGYDNSKFGCLPENTFSLIEAVLECPYLKLEGFMTIPPQGSTDKILQAFETLHHLRNQAQDAFNISLPELSMGMSQDFHLAILQGSTLIRLGTILFGDRN